MPSNIDKNTIFKTLGEFYKYPKCCINHFINHSDRAYIANSKHIAKGSGFVPCPSCFSQTKHMEIHEFTEWLGRNPFLIKKSSYSRAIARTKTIRFIKISEKNNLNLEAYRSYLFSMNK